jgi:hypothetical protein
MKSKRQKQIEARNRRIRDLFHIERQNASYLYLNLCLESVAERKLQSAKRDIQNLNRKLGLYQNHFSPTNLNLNAIQDGLPLTYFS